VDFKNTVIIMTSNIGSEFLLEGITNRGEIREGARQQVMNALRHHFRPEFLNRVDDIVLFKPLSLEEVKRIVDLLTADLARRLKNRKLALQITDPAREFIATTAYDPVYGARPLKPLLAARAGDPHRADPPYRGDPGWSHPDRGLGAGPAGRSTSESERGVRGVEGKGGRANIKYQIANCKLQRAQGKGQSEKGKGRGAQGGRAQGVNNALADGRKGRGAA